VTILTIIQLLLQIAGFMARRLDRFDIEKAVGDALLVALDKRADAAVDAADDIRSGRVPIDPDSPARRD
jgi:hypothetical protein